MLNIAQVCLWIGDGNGCRHPTIYGKAYCEEHYALVYHQYSVEAANCIIEEDSKELPE